MRPFTTRRRWAFGIAASIAAAALGCTGGQPPVTGGDAPAGDAFYVPPSPLKGSAPGDLQWSRTISASNYANASVHQILYRSVDASGEPMAVSGSVLVPKARYTGTGPRPIVAFAPATTGVTDDCAPSKGIATGSGGFAEGSNVKAALNKGWAVAVTDYQGLGTPGRHAYMVRPSQAHAVLDSVRAATHLADAGLSTAAPVVIWGYSQGGAAAGAAAELATTYAPELQVKGTAAGGVPGDLLQLNDHLEGGRYALALAAAFGFDKAYPELQIDQYLNAAGKAVEAQVFSETSKGACLQFLLNSYQGKHSRDYFTVEAIKLPVWQQRFTESKLGTVRPSAPVYQYHAAADQIIPNAIGQALRQRWCAVGATVQFNGSISGDHLIGDITGANAAVTFLGDRIAGRRAVGNC
jgi:hypothetical protein